MLGSVIMGTPAEPYKMTGVGLSFVPPCLDKSLIDAAYVVPETIGYSLCHALAKKDGLLLGASSGVILAGALKYGSLCPKGSRIVMINPDRGDRYLETIYDAHWLETHGFRIHENEELENDIASLETIRFS